MSSDLLVERARVITATTVPPPPPSPQPLLDQFWLIPGMTITCNTTLTSITLAVETHPATPTTTSLSYPQILFYESIVASDDNFESVVASYDVNVAFSSDGVYRLYLAPPLEVREGYIVGVYGSVPTDSPVTLYYINDTTAPTALVGEDKTRNIDDLQEVPNKRLLISPDIGTYHTITCC